MTAGAITDRQSSLLNAKPILNEIKHGLDRLLEGGHATIIDLQRMPFYVHDERYLRDVLGEGEVSATINTLGKSTVRESGVAGVWWITHYDEAGFVLGKYIEVTIVPQVLRSQQQDIRRGLRKLSTSLETANGCKNGQTRYTR